jgi:glycerol-3-phosphate dehydrogenase
MALTPLDILARRTSITLEDRHQGLEIVAEVATLMAPELNWSPDQQRAMTAAFRTEIEQQRLARRLPMQAAAADGAKDGESHGGEG